MMNTILKHKFLSLCVRAFIGTALFCITPYMVHAQTVANNQAADPVAVMQVAINDVLATLKSNQALYKSSPQKLRENVATSALSKFNIKRMAQLTLAKNWRGANAEQRTIYVNEFQRYLIRSYTETLYVYRNSKTKMLGAKISEKDKNKATVKISVESNNKTVLLFLRVELTEGNWKIVDINVEGISLIITTRGVFDEEINRVGLDGFLKNLTAKNNNAEQK